jgi:carboxypeptidase Taq
MAAYRKLAQHFRRLSHLEHLDAILSWDEAVMMPSGGGTARAEAMATLAELKHEMWTAPELEVWLGAAGEGQLSSWERGNLQLIDRTWRSERAVPAALVGRRSRQRMLCEQAWRTMREENDWKGFAPLLKEVVAIEREVAAAMGEALGLSPYDALIDSYDRGLTQERIDPIFKRLSEFLPDFVAQAVERSKQRAPVIPRGPFPIAAQRQLTARISRALGFDMQHGRLDESHHPFCGGVSRDVRITTRYDESEFLSALMGVVHETGHGCYEQGLPQEWLDQPIGKALGMALHESQSLLFEMQIGRSEPFLEFLAPLLREAFPKPAAAAPEAFAHDNLVRLYQQVEPGFIRVDADEATYPIHIILRYEIERDIFSGAMEVEDIPERWNAAMRERLDLDTSGDYKNGCMQDVHWPAGLFGYFPSYTLGAMVAAQLMIGLRKAQPDLDAQLQRGDLSATRAWLNDNVWSWGGLKTVDEILQDATGEPLNAGRYIEHLQRRYLGER